MISLVIFYFKSSVNIDSWILDHSQLVQLSATTKYHYDSHGFHALFRPFNYKADRFIKQAFI
jgi:hypothetical protein